MGAITGKAIWQVFIDFSIMAALLVVGELLRAKLKILQKLLIPAPVLAGFIALWLGPRGWGWLPLSKVFGTYAAVLIVVIFAATPIGDKPSKDDLSGKAIGGMFFNLTGIAILQYAVGMFLTMFVIQHIWTDITTPFGLMMATGYYGGHGTAAAVGPMLENLGFAHMTDFGYTTATVGIVGGIITGVAIINWGTRRGYTHYVESPELLPVELRTGLVPPEKQKQGGKVTVSSIVVDPLSFHLGIVLIASILGYYSSAAFKAFTKMAFNYGVAVPEFCLSLMWGFIFNWFLNKTGGQKYIDRHTISRIQGAAADFLMVSGVGSLNLKVVMTYAGPLIIVCVAGFVINWLWFIYVGGKSSPRDWFERNMMVWGHATGVAATGVLLQRIVDPDLRSRGIEDSGIGDIFNRPFIIGFQVIPPILMGANEYSGGMITMIAAFAIVAIMWLVAWKFGWWDPNQKLMKYRDENGKLLPGVKP